MELIKLNNKAELIKTLKQLAQHNKFQVRVLGNTRYKKEVLQDITKFISLLKNARGKTIGITNNVADVLKTIAKEGNFKNSFFDTEDNRLRINLDNYKSVILNII
ncbi:MAG: hypothetical protein SOV35_00560 [Clostridium sp.]|nr:hypothetical protein [Clostridium sp.]